jgi:hypothetical protein
MTTKVGRRQIRTPKTRATTTEKEEEMTEEGTGMKRMMGKEEPMKKARVRGRKDRKQLNRPRTETKTRKKERSRETTTRREEKPTMAQRKKTPKRKKRRTTTPNTKAQWTMMKCQD